MFSKLINIFRNKKTEFPVQSSLESSIGNDLIKTLIRAKSSLSNHRFQEGLDILEEIEESNVEKYDKHEVLEYYSLKAFCLMQLNYSFDALVYYNKAIDLDNENLINFYERGIVLNSLIYFKEAIHDFNNAIRLSKTSSPRNSAYELYARDMGYFNVQDMINFQLGSSISGDNQFSSLLDKIDKSNDQDEISKLEDMLNMMKRISLSKVKRRN